MDVTWTQRDHLERVVSRKILPAKVLADIGPGIRPQTFVWPRLHICIEPHAPYIAHLRRVVGESPRYLFLNSTWESALSLLPAKSIDSLFALDIIEHLEKSDGHKFLKEAERVVRKQIVIFTPLGFYPQAYDQPDKADRWGMDGGYWQTHRSGWTPEDFAGPGWQFVCCQDYHLIDENGRPLNKPHGALWALRDLCPQDESSTAGVLSAYSLGIRNLVVRFRRELYLQLPPYFYNALRGLYRWTFSIRRRHR